MRYGLCTTAGITITPPPPSLEILISGSNFFSTPFDCVCVCSRLFFGGKHADSSWDTCGGEVGGRGHAA